MMSDLEEAQKFFYTDKYAREATGIDLIEVGDKTAKCSLKLQDKHRNGYGNVMGGAIFTMADFTFAVASNFRQTPCVSGTSQVTFLSSSKGTTLFSEAHCIKNGKTTCFYKVEITDDLGAKVANVTFYGIKLNK